MRVATVWKLQLQMADWIAGQLKICQATVGHLKRQWLDEHSYFLHENCFFCDSAMYKTGSRDSEVYCEECPGRRVYKNFHCCQHAGYHWSENPFEFIAKLHRMDKKRLQMLREKRTAQ